MVIDDRDTARTPAWLWPTLIFFSLVEPAQHIWIKYFPPEGSVPTGLHLGDSSVFLVCMRMFETGFASPFASCKSPFGDHYIGYFSAPFHWLYGVVGAIGDLLGVDPFLWLGIANGLCAFTYLYVVYRLLREAVPAQANLAFLLFLFAGGPAGVLYLGAGALGWHGSPTFDAAFTRIAFYELMEGQHLWPILHLPRLYYTLPLAIALGGLTAFIKALRIGCPRHLAFSGFLLLAGTFLNQRTGPMVCTLALLYLWCRHGLAPRERIKAAVVAATGTAAGGVLSVLMLRLGVTFVENTWEAVRQSMWLTSFANAAGLYLAVVPGRIAHALKRLPHAQRVLVVGAIGYLALFSILYNAHLAYHGNWLSGGDTAAAAAVSDWALLGAFAGMLYAHVRRVREVPEQDDGAWIVLWLLLFVSIALSAFGQGWFLRLVPRRFMILIALPLAILAAQQLQAMRPRHPRLSGAITALLLVYGITNIAVASLFFQGPLGHAPGKGPFAGMHYEYMTAADGRIIDRIPEGRVLTPPAAPIAFGDVLAARPHLKTMIGYGLYDLSDEHLIPLEAQAAEFFSPRSDETFRKNFVAEWCVDYVYCPDTAPVDPETLDQLGRHTWLEKIAQEGQGALFRVESY